MSFNSFGSNGMNLASSVITNNNVYFCNNMCNFNSYVLAVELLKSVHRH